MANVITTLLKLDGTQFKTGMKAAQQSIRETDGVVGKAKAGWASAFAGFASSPVAIGAATAAVGVFASQSIKAASDLDESINAVNVTFGESADQILEFGDNAARSVGLAKAEFNQLATPLGSILKNAGFGLDEVADKTITLTQRAADMASVFNTDVSVALGAIQAGLRGEQDPLERFGVGLSAAKVEARALADTGKETAKQLTDQEKQLARVEIILDQTNQTAGDFAATSDGLANQTRILNAELTNLKAAAGQQLVPILSDLAGLLLDISENAGKAKDAIEDIPGGKGLLDALGTNLFELPRKSKQEWDDLGRAIGVVPEKAQEIGALRDQFNQIVSAGNSAKDAVEGVGTATADTADEVVDLGDKAANSGPQIGDMAGALDDAEQHLADLNEEARNNALGILADAAAAVGEAVDSAFSEIRDNLDLRDLVDDITDQFGEIAEAQSKLGEDGEEGARRYDRAVRDLQRQLLTLLDTVNRTPDQKIEIATEIQRGSLDDLYRILGDLTKGVTVPVSFAGAKIPGFNSANAVFTPGAAPSAPTFSGVSTPVPVQLDQRQITINYPVGSTPTTQYIDGQIDFRRNGVR